MSPYIPVLEKTNIFGKNNCTLVNDIKALVLHSITATVEQVLLYVVCLFFFNVNWNH